MLIRADDDADRAAIYAITEAAFSGVAEADLVNRLRNTASPIISLLAEQSGIVVVPGHSEYYPKFGFSPSTHFDLRCEYEVPAEVFMAMELSPGYLQHSKGLIRYHAEFSKL